jgi:hypothetical protein
MPRSHNRAKACLATEGVHQRGFSCTITVPVLRVPCPPPLPPPRPLVPAHASCRGPSHSAALFTASFPLVNHSPGGSPHHSPPSPCAPPCQTFTSPYSSTAYQKLPKPLLRPSMQIPSVYPHILRSYPYSHFHPPLHDPPVYRKCTLAIVHHGPMV